MTLIEEYFCAISVPCDAPQLLEVFWLTVPLRHTTSAYVILRQLTCRTWTALYAVLVSSRSTFGTEKTVGEEWSDAGIWPVNVGPHDVNVTIDDI